MRQQQLRTVMKMRAQADEINLKKKKSNEDNPDFIDIYDTNESVPRSHKSLTLYSSTLIIMVAQ